MRGEGWYRKGGLGVGRDERGRVLARVRGMWSVGASEGEQHI